MATGDLQIKFGKDRSSGSRDMRTDRHTHTQTHRQTDRCTDRWIDHNTPHPDLGGVKSVGLKGLTERQPHTAITSTDQSERDAVHV